MASVLHLICWESGAGFLDQLQSKANKTNRISDNFRRWIENFSILHFYSISFTAILSSFVGLFARAHRKLSKNTLSILALSIMVNAGAVYLLITASTECLKSAKASQDQTVLSGIAMKIHTSLKLASEVNGLCTSTKLRGVSECRENSWSPSRKFCVGIELYGKRRRSGLEMISLDVELKGRDSSFGWIIVQSSWATLLSHSTFFLPEL